LEEKYEQRPPQELEAAADQYAERMWAVLVASKVIPFPRRMAFEDHDPTDFIPGILA
jgi:hypothetical protein